ncbi:His/Gly/Thr/Pro-type tRNA ligase C-terminal domain-containing protein [Patescibacteria group bacterium]
MLSTSKNNNKIDMSDEIAYRYGFSPMGVFNGNIRENNISYIQPENQQMIQSFVDNKSNHPSLIYHNPKQKSKSKNKNLGLDVIGVSSSISEALVIKTSLSILKDEGYKDVFIDINSLGDKESMINFEDELLKYYKKNTDILPDSCKKVSKSNVMDLFFCDHTECELLKAEAPKPINYLSNSGMNHFKEILEYLESMGIDYRINNSLIDKDKHYSKVIFEIKTENLISKKENKIEEIILARGGRYDDVARKIGRKRKLPAVGISIDFERLKKIQRGSNTPNKSKVYLVQFGFEAKRKSLEIIETLRKMKISVYQNIYRDKLSEQLEIAKKLNIPYLVIVGQKEALEDTVMVRHVPSAFQETVSLKNLERYMRSIR